MLHSLTTLFWIGFIIMASIWIFTMVISLVFAIVGGIGAGLYAGATWVGGKFSRKERL